MKRSKIHEETTVDEHGEIKSRRSVSVFQSHNEAFYVKTYMEHIEHIMDLTKAEIVVFFILNKYITYKNTIHITVGIKDKISQQCNYTLGTINKCVVGLHKKKWLLSVSRGTYMVNPEFIGKGGWKSISEIRSELFEENGFLFRK